MYRLDLPGRNLEHTLLLVLNASTILGMASAYCHAALDHTSFGTSDTAVLVNVTLSHRGWTEQWDCNGAAAVPCCQA